MFKSLLRSVNLRLPSRLTIVQTVTSLLAPPTCALCGGDGQRAAEPWGIDLCCYCEAACPRPELPCPRCAEPAQGGACLRCSEVPPPFDSTCALFLYADPVDQMVTALKFGGELAFGRVLGILLARELRARAQRLPHWLVPVPLHGERYRERGFNQAEVIAGHVARRLGVRLDTRLLQRVRSTAPQSRQSASARRANIEHAFVLRPGSRVPPRVALLDDVMTTGSTAAAAARALRAGGARRIEIWTCARAARSGAGATPRPVKLSGPCPPATPKS